jgi:DNA-binding transcriptional regulator GbsR (MarR family)
LGLSETDAQVYICLAMKGPKKIGDIAEELQLQGHLLSLSLKHLQSKRIVNSTLEHSIFFQALPFEEALELLVRANMATVQNIEQNRDRILSKWLTMIKDSKDNNL